MGFRRVLIQAGVETCFHVRTEQLKSSSNSSADNFSRVESKQSAPGARSGILCCYPDKDG